MWRTVDKAEFDSFLASYPRTLSSNVSGIVEPPQRTYYDSSEPVAAVSLRQDYGEPDVYYLRA